MAYTEPDEAVAQRLAGAGIGLTAGQNLFKGPVRAPSAHIAAKAVFALATGGPAHRTYLGTDHDLRYLTVQVRIRGEAEDFDAGQTLARQVLDALHRAPITGYVSCTVREPHPVWIGPDAAGRPEWSLNALLIVRT